MFTVTAKIQILPSPEQQQILFDTMKAYKNACNFVSDYIFETHNLVQASVNRALYYDTRLRFGLRSQMSQSVQKTVIAKYKTILETAEKWTKPTFQKPQYDLVWNRDYSLTEGLFSVNTLQGRIKVAFYSEGMEQYFDSSWSFGTAKLINKKSKWFLHISMSKNLAELNDFNVSHVVGVDLGINFLATAYDSFGKTTFYNGRQIKNHRAKYKELRRSLPKIAP